MSEQAELSLPTFQPLPSPNDAPILRHLEELGVSKFREHYAIETPCDEDGVVNASEFIQELQGLMDDPDYKWHAPFFDLHHLHWERRRYLPENNGGDELPLTFREIPTQKIWLPRQLHNLGHVAMLEPPMPSRDVMREHIRLYKRRNHIFNLANAALIIVETSERVRYIPSHNYSVDLKTRRTYLPDVLEGQLNDFVKKIELSLNNGKLPNDAVLQMTIDAINEAGSIEDALTAIRANFGEAAGVFPYKRTPSVSVPIQPAA